MDELRSNKCLKSLETMRSAMSKSDGNLAKFQPIRGIIAEILGYVEDGAVDSVTTACARLKDEVLEYNDDADTLDIKNAAKLFANNMSRIEKKDYLDFNELLSGSLGADGLQFWMSDGDAEDGVEEEAVDYGEMYNRCSDAVRANKGNLDDIVADLTRCAEEGGVVDSYYWLGRIYADSLLGARKDGAKASRYYMQGADKGDSDCLVHLYLLYSEGNGVPKDIGKALSMLEKGVKAGNNDAKMFMAEYLLLTAKRDYQRAFRLAKEAADGGNRYAHCLVGYAYEYGCGVAADMERAADIYNREKKQGNKFADGFLSDYAKHLADIKRKQQESKRQRELEAFRLRQEAARKSREAEERRRAEEHQRELEKRQKRERLKRKFKNCFWSAVVLLLLYHFIFGGIGTWIKNTFMSSDMVMLAEMGTMRSSEHIVDDNVVIDSIPYGTTLSVKGKTDGLWVKAKVAVGTGLYEGYVASALLVTPGEYQRFESIFAADTAQSAATREMIKEVSFRRALLNYYIANSYIGYMTKQQLDAAGIGVQPDNNNQYVLIGKLPSSSVGNVKYAYERTVLAVILTNFSTGARYTVVFVKDADGNASDVYREAAPDSGGIVSVNKDGDNYKISYATKAKTRKNRQRSSSRRRAATVEAQPEAVAESEAL